MFDLCLSCKLLSTFQDEEFKGYMTKSELSHAAQPFSDKSFTVVSNFSVRFYICYFFAFVAFFFPLIFVVFPHLLLCFCFVVDTRVGGTLKRDRKCVGNSSRFSFNYTDISRYQEIYLEGAVTGTAPVYNSLHEIDIFIVHRKRLSRSKHDIIQVE